MRVTAPHQPDLSALHPDLNWGKWNSSLDLRKPEDRQLLKALVLEADVVVTGYRPGVLEKYGFGVKDIVDICSEREKGIIVAQENCYGWHGPWAGRSGWQQISDASWNALLMGCLTCGVSMEFGRAMGHDAPVTPVFPNSDYWYGIT
ncbi:Succinyl-CoA--D-citramalate CoA-transferase [Lachnellula arida]|uniref:Succinyl-CoA--D-citramalate CoA-transferase n=1 Tax=Lachnellula arida TaxID=1316785 RepID=A0A8T9BME8_9HELO|nr:Succinyl-CoA--D-citramalate CoA-transferase [Lachnellula arida]